jgi:hypothetical protein
VYPYIPCIHPARFLAKARLPFASNLRPPPCLIYAMWAMAASTSETYKPVQDIFYQRARKYAEQDEMRSFGEQVCTVGHIQAWVLICLYESFNMYLVRGFLSIRKAAALILAAGLHKLDGVGLATTMFLSPAEDWTDLEERRRTFWAIFMHDRFLSAGSGFTPAFDEQDVSLFSWCAECVADITLQVQTDLPALEEAFESCTFAKGMKLSEATTPTGKTIGPTQWWANTDFIGRSSKCLCLRCKGRCGNFVRANCHPASSTRSLGQSNRRLAE